MIWDIIAKKIEDAGIAYEGESLFEATMPADERFSIGLFQPIDGIHVDANLPDFYKPVLKVIVRHEKASEGRKIANRVMNLLTITHEEEYEANEERGRVILKVFHPRSLPVQYPNADNGLIEFAISFVTAFTLKPI